MAVLGSPLSAHPGSVWDLLEVCEVSRENDLFGYDAFKVRVKCYAGVTLNFVFVFNDHVIKEVYSGVFLTTITDTESIFYFHPFFSYAFDDLVSPVTLDFGINDRYALWDNGDEPDVAGDLYAAEYRTSSFVSDSLDFVDAAACTVVRSFAVEDAITFTDLSGFYWPRDVADSLTFSDDVNRTLTMAGVVEDVVTFSDIASAQLLLRLPVSDSISFSDSVVGIVVANKGVEDTVSFSDAVDFYRTKTVSDAITFSDTASRTGSVYNRSITDSVSFSDSNAVFVLQALADSVTFSDSVAQTTGKGGHDALVLSDSVSRAGSVFRRSVSDTLELADAVIGYSPTVCEDVVQDSVSETVLEYPFTSPTHTATLPNPDFADNETLTSSVEIRVTRGGTRVNTRHSTWHDDTILSLEFSAMTEDEADDLVSLVEASAGDEIKLTDHENRVWKGVIVNPVVPVIQGIGSCKYKASLVFEGTLQ